MGSRILNLVHRDHPSQQGRALGKKGSERDIKQKKRVDVVGTNL